nr:hypothetical protein [Bacteroidota bacterium]
MKKHLLRYTLLLCIALFLGTDMYSQNVAINADGSDPDASAMLDIKAENMGILIPRVTEANRPSSPATGLLIYQTDGATGFYFYDGSNWKLITHSGEFGTMAAQDADDVLITGGTIDGVAIGGTDPSTGKFTTLTATGATMLYDNLTVSGDTDIAYQFTVDATTGEVTAQGNISGKELRTLSGSLRIAEGTNDDIPWINALKEGNKVMEMGLGTDGSGNPAGYGLNINNDDGNIVAGMGYSWGKWANGVVDPSTYAQAGAWTNGAGGVWLEITGADKLDNSPFKADVDGNLELGNDLFVGTMTSGDGTSGTFSVEGSTGNTEIDGTLNVIGKSTFSTMALTTGASDGYILKSDGSGNATWVELTTANFSGLGTIASQDADDVSISGGNIDGTAIGVSSASSGKFTTLETTSTATIGGDLTVNQNTDNSYQFEVSSTTGDVTAQGNIKGKELQTLSGSLRIAEGTNDDIPWINSLKEGNKVFEMGLGTDGAGDPAGYGINVNNDAGNLVLGMGMLLGDWVSGVIDPSTGIMAGFGTDGAGNVWIQMVPGPGKTDPLFSVDQEGEVIAQGNISGKELRTLSGSIRIAEGTNDDIPWINALKGSTKVFEMGLGTDGSGDPAGYGLNINNDSGETVAGMGYSYGKWANGVVDPSTYAQAGAWTNGAGGVWLEITGADKVANSPFKADVDGNLELGNDLYVGTMAAGDGTGGTFSVEGASGNTEIDGTLDVIGKSTFSTMALTTGASDGYILKSDGSGNATWTELNTTNFAGLGTIASQDADDVSISGGNIDGTAIGVSTASSGKFTTLETTSTATIGGDLTVNQNTDNSYQFEVSSTTGDVTAQGNIKGKELQTLSGNLRLAEGTNDDIPWINALKSGNKVMEMGLGTDGAGDPAGYGLNINNDAGETVAGMGYSYGNWVNGVVDPTTFAQAGASTDGAGNVYLEITNPPGKPPTSSQPFKADMNGDLWLGNDFYVGTMSPAKFAVSTFTV